MKIVARTPVGGYVPGQTINLEIIADNESDQPATRFWVELMKVNESNEMNAAHFHRK